MTQPRGTSFADLASTLEAKEFPDVDLALRRGRHIDQEDDGWYEFLTDAQEHLEPFYRRFGCELVHRTDGYFCLIPSGDKLPRKHLAISTMLVGQALALLYLDPATVQHGGAIDRDQVLAQLDGVVGTDALIRIFNPKRRRYDERVAQETVRKRVAIEVRRLAGLGFVELVEGARIRLRPALLRFAEPVRGTGSPAEALAQLVARGEVVLADTDTDADADADADDNPANIREHDGTDDCATGSWEPNHSDG